MTVIRVTESTAADGTGIYVTTAWHGVDGKPYEVRYHEDALRLVE